MKACDLIARIESVASPKRQSPWDKSGIQVAGRMENVSRLAVMLDPIPATVARAFEWNADFLLSHHPLAIEPKLPSRIDGYHEVLRLVFTHDAWLYSAHTSLDTNPAGPVSWLADSLGLSRRQVLEPVPSVEDAFGFGMVGDLPEPVSVQDFYGMLEAAVSREFLTSCGPEPEKIVRVAFCPGSGSSMLEKAFDMGADVFITGDMKYHQALEAPGLVIDVGHFALEEEMMRRFADYLSGELVPENVEVRFFKGREPFRVRPIRTS